MFGKRKHEYKRSGTRKVDFPKKRKSTRKAQEKKSSVGTESFLSIIYGGHSRGSLLFRRLDNNTPIDQPANVYMTAGKYIFLEEVFAKMRKICEDGAENIESSAGIEWLVYFHNGPQSRGLTTPLHQYIYIETRKQKKDTTKKWPIKPYLMRISTYNVGDHESIFRWRNEW